MIHNNEIVEPDRWEHCWLLHTRFRLISQCITTKPTWSFHNPLAAELLALILRMEMKHFHAQAGNLPSRLIMHYIHVPVECYTKNANLASISEYGPIGFRIYLARLSPNNLFVLQVQGSIGSHCSCSIR